MSQFFGKYRGKVVNNVDPLLQGRVQVSCLAVPGDGRMSWALPCAPYGGPGVGLFTVPPMDANVWVEFEGGEPDYPIWTKCFWGAGQAPPAPAIPQMKVLKTDGVTLTAFQTPSSVRIEGSGSCHRPLRGRPNEGDGPCSTSDRLTWRSSSTSWGSTFMFTCLIRQLIGD